MKSTLCLILAFVLLLGLCGCGSTAGKDQATFYYPRIEFDFGSSNSIMVPELHDVTGHADDLWYMLSLYLRGPTDPELKFAFPDGTILVEMLQEDSTVTVTLFSPSTQLSDIDLNIACVCLAETCFAISDAQQVHIQSLASISGKAMDTTITRGNILLPGYEILPEDTE